MGTGANVDCGSAFVFKSKSSDVYAVNARTWVRSDNVALESDILPIKLRPFCLLIEPLIL
jgi:hypothetical protein